MKQDKREKLLDKGYDYEGFDLKGIHHKPLTVKGIKVLKMVNSPYFTYDPNEWMDTTLDYLFVTSQDSLTVNAAKSTPEAWRDTIDEFSDNYTLQDLLEAKKLVAEATEMIFASIVTNTDDGEEPAEKK